VNWRDGGKYYICLEMEEEGKGGKEDEVEAEAAKMTM